jgi:hypothetical protein
MADYTKATNFTAKDGLPTGNAGKIVKGTEIDTELTAVSNAIASKADINSPTFTGTPAAPTATAGSNTTQIATTAFVIAERTSTSTLTNKTLTSPVINTPTISTPTITGGTITGITDLTVADGGTGRSTLAANAVLLGNGTSGINSVAPGTSGNILASDGTAWSSTALSALAAFASNQANTGYQKLPSGLILQWTRGAAFSSLTWDIAFPNAVFMAVVSTTSANRTVGINSLSTTAVSAAAYNPGTGAQDFGTVYIFAIGN